MSDIKRFNPGLNVHDAAVARIKLAFDSFEKLYISFSGGKDSTTMFHLVMDEAIARDRRVGVLIIDLEAQYEATIKHMLECIKRYEAHIDLHWVCLPMALRNAVSNYDPRWICWDPVQRQGWVRELPDNCISDTGFFPFFRHGMEFEEFMVEFGLWYSAGATTGAFVGIRTDESLNRFRTIASQSKQTLDKLCWTTRVVDGQSLYNLYPIYDWAVSDLWHYHHRNPAKAYNVIYDYMHKAGLSPSQMRLCQPYGDDQRKGLWLYHILEPQTWHKVVNRVSGANSGALYVQETGNITGYNKISKPAGHTWKSYCNLLLGSLPLKTQDHYLKRFRVFIKWWKKRGYPEGIPDEAPAVLENHGLAPSFRRLCKALLRNDYWCKGLKFSQPKSEPYKQYLEQRKAKQQPEGEVRTETLDKIREVNELKKSMPTVEAIKKVGISSPTYYKGRSEVMSEPQKISATVVAEKPKDRVSGGRPKAAQVAIVITTTDQIMNVLDSVFAWPQ